MVAGFESHDKLPSKGALLEMWQEAPHIRPHLPHISGVTSFIEADRPKTFCSQRALLKPELETKQRFE